MEVTLTNATEKPCLAAACLGPQARAFLNTYHRRKLAGIELEAPAGTGQPHNCAVKFTAEHLQETSIISKVGGDT